MKSDSDGKDLKMNLYIWESVLWNYGPGMACAIAHTKEEAIQLLLRVYATSQGKYATEDEMEEFESGLRAEHLILTRQNQSPIVLPVDKLACYYLRGSS
jgi:hypothetical protein